MAQDAAATDRLAQVRVEEITVVERALGNDAGGDIYGGVGEGDGGGGLGDR